MRQYALVTMTPDGTEQIYGVGEGVDELDVMANRDNWFAPPREAQRYGCRPADELADGQWREVAPVGPQDEGDIGGDIQMGAAWSRRFALRRPDGQWAMITDSFYAACRDGVNGPVTDESELYVQNQIEWLVCTDLRDPGSTETWSDYEYEDEERVYRMDELKRVDERARIRAARKDVDSYSWNGEDE
jgi:hypothetical protein